MGKDTQGSSVCPVSEKCSLHVSEGKGRGAVRYMTKEMGRELRRM